MLAEVIVGWCTVLSLPGRWTSALLLLRLQLFSLPAALAVLAETRVGCTGNGQCSGCLTLAACTGVGESECSN
jgi:hypothetical protein